MNVRGPNRNAHEHGGSYLPSGDLRPAGRVINPGSGAIAVFLVTSSVVLL